VVSWGVLLKNAQNVEAVALHPWLLIPGLFVIITVFAFNFLGDGLRDAADPYNINRAFHLLLALPEPVSGVGSGLPTFSMPASFCRLLRKILTSP